MSDTIKPGLYEHYKGRQYEVIGLAHHSETLEPLVVYIALYETKFGKDSLWVRPLSMFTEMIQIDGKKVERFRWIKGPLKPSDKNG